MGSCKDIWTVFLRPTFCLLHFACGLSSLMMDIKLIAKYSNGKKKYADRIRDWGRFNGCLKRLRFF
jgi:hypothetical protein